MFFRMHNCSRRSFSILFFGSLFFLLFFVRCNSGVKDTMISIAPVATAYDGSKYAGSQRCIACHENIYNEHLKTPHYNTSQLVSDDNVVGDFKVHNILKLNEHIVFKMIDEDQLYQAAFKDERFVRKEPFDIIIGSGTKGQTFLYWNDNRLYQLPVSYLNKSNKWIHSPGYSNDRIHFDRAVIPNCLECHTTFARNHLPTDFNSNMFVKKEMIFGVDCESCHGPSLKHVNAHINDPELKMAQHILDIKTLTRQQQLDACARCHSGLGRPLKMPFTFKTGDKLDSFRIPNYMPIDTTKLDVHGNQYGLLTMSKCFKRSESLNCTTCHDPHKNERQQSATFSQKCIGCHQDAGNHSFSLEHQEKLDCISCHMPLLTTSAITFNGLNSNDHSDSIKVRTHKIGIYGNELP
ncbi:multiheme c-type cytochrome [Sungkyunkwania multivorans]|uniref:Multiheme c-type cytochrome n=1 Tax=Sungkyunkwania multivorans TaxID=1173618 RepID=A0ABW3CYB1_9FLAO